MSQEEKIELYLLGQLSDEETAAFRAEIRADPALTAEVKRRKVKLIAEEIEVRTKLRENMDKWKEELPPPIIPPPIGWLRRYAPILGLSALLLLGLAVWKWCGHTPTQPVDPVNTSQPTIAQENVPIANPPDETTDPTFLPPVSDGAPTPRGRATLHFQRWATAFLTLTINRYDQAVAMRGTSRTGATQPWKPQPLNKPYYGFVLQKGNKHYVVASAAAVALASVEWGAVIGKDAQGQSHGLRLLGKDDLYDLAVLELPTTVDWEKRALRWGNNPKITTNTPVFQFNGPLTTKNPEKNWTATQIRQQQGFYLLSNSQNGQGSTEGPLLDTAGQVVGVVSPLARAAFGLQPSDSRHIAALSAAAIGTLIDQLLENKTIRRPYFGIAFEQRAGGVWIFNILSGSPASPYVDQLLGARVDSLNGTAIRNLLDVNEALAAVRPRAAIRLAGMGTKGQRLSQRLYAKPMDDTALQAIGEGAVNNMDGFSMLHEPGEPKVEYKGALFEKGIYHILAACPGRTECADNVLTLTDLGIQMRSVALQKEGVLRVFNINAPEKPLYYPIQLQHARLWH